MEPTTFVEWENLKFIARLEVAFSPMFLEQYQKGNKFPRALKHLIILLKYLKKYTRRKKYEFRSSQENSLL